MTGMDMFWPSSAVDQDGTLLVAFEVQGGREDRALSVSRSELGVFPVVGRGGQATLGRPGED